MAFSKIIFSALLCSLSFMTYAQGNMLVDYKWEKRVILLFAPQASTPEILTQEKIIAQDKLGFAERDLIVLKYYLDNKNGMTLRDKFKVSLGEFTFILIGKDGGVKLRKNKVVLSNDLFDLIDSMPMRRGEIRRKKG